MFPHSFLHFLILCISSISTATTSGDCGPADDIELEAVTKYFPFGRPGIPFGDTMWNRHPPKMAPDFVPRPVQVRVSSKTSKKPLENCKIEWDSGFGIRNGWIFPTAVDHKTDVNGIAEAHWIAGSAIDQEITASVTGVADTKVTVGGKAGGHRILAAAVYTSFKPDEVWNYWKQDLRLVKFPSCSYYAIIHQGPMYSGFLPGKGRGLLFTTWWHSATMKTQILDPPNENFSNVTAGVYNNVLHCHQTFNGAEGNHASCEYDYEFKESHEYRIEMEKVWYDNVPSSSDPPILSGQGAAPGGGGHDAPATDLSIFFTDLTLGGPRKKVATMRYHGRKLQDRETSGFLEMPCNDKYTCLDTPLQHVVFKAVEYATPAEPNTFKSVNKMSIGYHKGCANTRYYVEKSTGHVHLSNGGHAVSYPAYYPSTHPEYGGITQIDLNRKLIVDVAKFKDSMHAEEAYLRTDNCTDGLKNGDELGVDCGGTFCSNLCPAGPNGHCLDGIHNGNEDYVDCGGSCSPCDSMLGDRKFVVLQATEDVPDWERCAGEYQSCECIGKVRFGVNNRWTAEIDVAGKVYCSFHNLGDPAPGRRKQCECKKQSTYTWEEGQAACAAHGNGGKLAEIRSRYENRLVKDLCANITNECWIGLQRAEGCVTPSCWHWVPSSATTSSGSSVAPLYLDQTLFNHWGYPMWKTIYDAGNLGVKLVATKGLGEWAAVSKSVSLKGIVCTVPNNDLPKFGAAMAPPATPETTGLTDTDRIGDSHCNGWLNNEENSFDGGDCCGENVNLSQCNENCINQLRCSRASFSYEFRNCVCIDPNYKTNDCPENPLIGDNVCNGNLNNEENCFDGGDCCGAWDCNFSIGLVDTRLDLVLPCFHLTSCLLKTKYRISLYNVLPYIMSSLE